MIESTHQPNLESEPSMEHWMTIAAREIKVPRDARVPVHPWAQVLAALPPRHGVGLEFADRNGTGRATASISVLVAAGAGQHPAPEQILRLLSGMLLPGVEIGAAAAASMRTKWDLVPHPVLAPPPSCTARPLRPEDCSSDASALIAPSDWRWSLDQALAILAGGGGGAIRFLMRPVQADSMLLRALEQLKSDLLAHAYRERQGGEYADSIQAMLQLPASRQFARVDVAVDLATSDPFSMNMLTLALFGSATGAANLALPACLVGVVGDRCLPPLPTPTMLNRTLPRPCAQDEMAADGSITVGTSPTDREICISARDRMRHCYILGATGTGKSTLMRELIRQDIEAGDCVILVDPHGDLALEVFADVPWDFGHSVIVADAASEDGGCAFDMLSAVRDPDTREQAFDSFMSVFRKTLYDNADAFGPMFDQYFRNALFLLAMGGSPDAELADLHHVLTSGAHRKQMIARCPDPIVSGFWTDIAARTSGEADLANIVPYIIAKLTRFIGSPLARRLFSPRGGTLDFEHIIAEGQSLILRLPKGELGEGTAQLAASVALGQIARAAMGRPAGHR